MKAKLCILIAGLFFATSPIFATTINISLGQSAQNYTATGLGPDASFDGQWQIQQGPCAFNGTTSVCNFSGNYTGGTTGFTSGTYDFQTTFPGNSFSPLIGQSTVPFGNSFFFSFVGPGVTMDLFLNDVSGHAYDIPVFQGGNFVSNYFVAFTSSNCSGTPISPCSFANSGQNLGSIFSSPVTGGATFDTANANPVPEPSSLVLAGSGMLALAGIVRRKFARR